MSKIDKLDGNHKRSGASIFIDDERKLLIRLRAEEEVTEKKKDYFLIALRGGKFDDYISSLDPIEVHLEARISPEKIVGKYDIDYKGVKYHVDITPYDVMIERDEA